MYTWRCFLAILFVLVWYFSECGLIWKQAFICFLCFFNFGFKKQDRETCTQTDDTLDETQQQVTRLLLLLHISTYDPSYYYYLYYFECIVWLTLSCLEIELTIFWTTVSKVCIGWFKLVISCLTSCLVPKSTGLDWTGLTSWYPVSCFSEMVFHAYTM